MNRGAINAIDNMLEGFYHGNNWIDSLLKIITAGVTLVVSVNEHCNTHQFVYDSISFCFITNRCSGWNLIVNFLKNLYPMAIALMQICTEYVTRWKVSSLHELKESYRTIGS